MNIGVPVPPDPALPQQQPGAVVGKHRVLVMDAPGPKEARGPSAASQQKYAEYLASLKNRQTDICRFCVRPEVWKKI